VPREEVIVPFPTPREQIPAVRRIRSGLLCSSFQAIRAQGLEAAYFEKLPRERHERIITLTAAEWIDPELAFAHYEALEALAIPPSQIEENGRTVAQQLQRGFLSVALRLAVESGVTPWSVLERFPKLWERYFDGSAIAVWKLGPKEARTQVVGFPLARIGYIRIGVGGIIRGVLELVCKRAYVLPVRAQCDATTLTYRISWA
jgi:hypothetical protein